MTEKKRFIPLRLRLLAVMLAGLLLAAGMYLLCNAVTDEVIVRTYMSESAVRARNTKTMQRFQHYVQENRLSSHDTDAIARWTMAEKDIYILFYQNERLALEAGWWGIDESAGDEAATLPSAMELYPVSFSDGVFQAIIYDFSEQTLYTVVTIGSLVLGCAVFALVMLLYNDRITRSIIAVGHQVERIGQGDLEHAMQSSRRDELGGLVRSVDAMRRSILEKTQEEALARQKNSELITAMSHDLRNPLTALMGYLGLAVNGQYRSQDELQQYIAASYEKAAQLRQLTDRLFRYTTLYGGDDVTAEPQYYDAHILVEQLTGEVAATLEQYGFTVRTAIGPLSCSVCLDMLLLKRVTDNLLDNIRKYADPAQPVHIAAQRDGAWLSLCMDNAVRRDPDRTQSNRIGLRACRKLLEQMHGQFVTHEENGRFCAELLIPAGVAAAAEEQPPTE